ncbi:MAG: flagellar biosynthesis protein [Pseudomonadota bacterium]|nr:flagellar biosynthesis protein [Pseudomonadota bacterium]
MRDFYANANAFTASSRMPLDQADGLRRLFAGRRAALLPICANPHVAFSAGVLDRLAAVLAAQGRDVLVVDAAGTSPLPHELATLDLAACIEAVATRIAYLPARGLPLAHVDTRGGAGGFIDALLQAAPQTEVIVLHADATDLARILKHREARPLLLGADHPESIKHAYANAKLLARRCELMTYDLLLVSAPHSPRTAAIGRSLAGCLENFLGALLRGTAVIDPAGELADAPDAALQQLLSAQLDGAEDTAPSLPAWRAAAPRSNRSPAVHSEFQAVNR